MTTPETSNTATSGSAWQLGREERGLARRLALGVVSEVAAGELPLFEQRAQSHFRPRLWSRRPLSLDVVGLAAEVVTPAALSAAAGVVGVMSAELVSRMTSRVAGRVSRRWRRSEPEAGRVEATPAPTAAELSRWHAAALAAARRHVSEPLAEQIADSVLAELTRMLAADAAAGPSSPDPTGLPAPEASGAGSPDTAEAEGTAALPPGGDHTPPRDDTEHGDGHGEGHGHGRRYGDDSAAR
ncbi:hypothetical protein [Streptomyces sp. NRRL F-2580]|uniref:hypothetical protein n=1 Tax=Streptomyces sp. NRRL F-2580 TaxID=1463841 RepID=UPI0004C6651C|nr:hypothetical protein [Streptomyces sp. NRRL F-2580]